MSLISLRIPSGGQQVVSRHLALGQMGFRPFFLLAAVFAAAAIPLWLAVLNGNVELQHRGGAILWHAHEMVFGYTVAVIAGFLLTAAIRWTGRETVSGGALYALAALWVLGRIAMLLSTRIPAGLVLALDLAFLPAVGIAVGRPIVAVGQRRNYVMLVLLGALWLANLAWHLAFQMPGTQIGVQGIQPWASAAALPFALNLVTVMMLIIGARVIPMFTRNATGEMSIRSSRPWNVATAVVMVAYTVSELAQAAPAVRAALAAGVALCAFVAVRHWGTRASLKQPLLWVLHIGYLWIPISLALRGLHLAGAPISASCSIHALTAGAIGTLTLGMMARVTMGHTGRPIVSSPLVTLAFALVTAAAVLRTAVPELGTQWIRQAWLVSGLAWTLAFIAFLLKFAPMLLTRRVDGKPG